MRRLRAGREVPPRQGRGGAAAVAVVVAAAAAALAPGRPAVAAGTARSPVGGAAHACVGPGKGRQVIDWSAMTNPIYAAPDAGVKDEALVWAGGSWHLLFSYLTDDPAAPGGVRWNIATATSPDLAHWSAPLPWPRQAGSLGVASPDVVRDPAVGFVVTYQSDPGEAGGGQDKLYYRTSRDLRAWSAPHPLARALARAPGDRMIDAALAFPGRGVILGYKSGTATPPPGTQGSGQAFEIAWSPSGSLRGPWVRVGRPAITVNGDTVENYEFLTTGARWRLVATSNNLDQPFLFTLTGDPSRPSGWLRWSAGTELSVPAQAFDTGPGISSLGFEHANSAFLCDATAVDGHYYLLYAGSTELGAFGGWGHARIGVARSTDLVHWEVPPG